MELCILPHCFHERRDRLHIDLVALGKQKIEFPMRVNGTQTVSALYHETVYDRKSGDTTIMENRYDDEYATLFKRAPEHKGMLVMINPQDGQVQAIVEICQKRK